jgi:hypothetical protein
MVAGARSLHDACHLERAQRATSRIPGSSTLFGDIGWVGLFGLPALITALLLVVRSVIDRRVDWTLAAGGAVMYIAYFLAMQASLGPSWTQIAENIVRNQETPRCSLIGPWGGSRADSGNYSPIIHSQRGVNVVTGSRGSQESEETQPIFQSQPSGRDGSTLLSIPACHE